MIIVEKENICPKNIQVYLNRWERMKTDLLALHAMREDTVGEDLLEGFGLYIEFLQHCHGLQHLPEEQIEQLEALPLNGKERLQFIKNSPKQYASFTQLDEMFSETVKKLARLRVQK
ncbi:YpoC family protein [Chungangia koreensis]|uniref:YpoC family protein n=1 Tax=Chungangia koreensis TaxID=752657 RepID=A0ABV8X6K1_9LACT